MYLDTFQVCRTISIVQHTRTNTKNCMENGERGSSFELPLPVSAGYIYKIARNNNDGEGVHIPAQKYQGLQLVGYVDRFFILYFLAHALRKAGRSKIDKDILNIWLEHGGGIVMTGRCSFLVDGYGFLHGVVTCTPAC